MAQSILIVDDEFGLADLLAELLREHGYEVEIAINGALGLECLAETRCDLVLVDMMMPILDGPAMLRRMRRTPELASLPVILMTAIPEAVPKDDPPLHQALLVKPLSLAKLLEAVTRL